MNKKLINKNAPRFYFVISLVVLQSAITVLLIYFLGNIIQKAVDGKNEEFYIQLSILASLTLFDVLLMFLNSRNKAILDEKIAFNLRKNILKNIDLYIEEDMSVDSGKINSILVNDVKTIVESRLAAIFTFIGGMTLFIGSMIVLFITSWIIGLIIFVCSLFVTIIPILFSNRMSKIQYELSNNKNQFNSNIVKELNDFKSYRFTNSLSKLQLKISNINSDFEKVNQNLFVKNNLLVTLLTSFSIFFQMSVVVITVVFFKFNFIPIAAVVTVSFLMGNTSGGLQSIIYSIPEYLMAKSLFNQRILESQKEINKQEIKKIELINFNLVRDEKKIYKNDLNINFEIGNKYQLIGKNGSGKSLLYSSLITQNSYEGQILINGEKPSQNWFEGSFWLLQTNPKIFNGDVKENISLFAKEIDLKKMRLILKNLDLDQELENKDATLLSDGQKQRIAIARAIYFDAQWLFLDEALSSLDLATSRKILEFIGKKCKTICLTSHHEIMEGEWFDETIKLS